MDASAFGFLDRLLNTPSPSGYERPVQDVVRAWAKPLADDVRTDRHGNVIAMRRAKTSIKNQLIRWCLHSRWRSRHLWFD